MLTAGSVGRQPWPAHVVLLATHADQAACPKNSRGEFSSDDAAMLLSTVQEKFALDFTISDHIFVVDAHLAMSVDLKLLRAHLGDIKADIVKVRRLTPSPPMSVFSGGHDCQGNR